ncbi:unnamed protein product, partial [Rotaria sordida]
WEKFLCQKLRLLEKFKFVINICEYQFEAIESILTAFRTPFWLEDKRWFITCQLIADNVSNSGLILYSSEGTWNEFPFNTRETNMSSKWYVRSDLARMVAARHLDQFHSNLNCEYCGEHFNSVDKFNEHKIFESSKLIAECILKGLFIRAKKENHYLIKQYQQAIFKLVRQISSQFNDRQMNIDLPRTTTTGACIPTTVQFEEVHEMLNILAGGVEALVNNEQRLSNESLQMQITLTILKEESSKLK